MNFYPFHIGDYASATRHLTWAEDMAYRRMLDAYYVKESPLPAEKRQVYRLVVASTDEQREAVDSVLSEFFTLTDRGYEHARCEAEIDAAAREKFLAASGTARRRAAKRTAEPRWLTSAQIEEIRQFYRLARFLSETTGTAYHVDHIVPLSCRSVCGLHVPWNLRVITAEENLKKHAKFGIETHA